jgi:hypothetical protein
MDWRLSDAWFGGGEEGCGCPWPGGGAKEGLYCCGEGPLAPGGGGGGGREPFEDPVFRGGVPCVGGPAKFVTLGCLICCCCPGPVK